MNHRLWPLKSRLSCGCLFAVLFVATYYMSMLAFFHWFLHWTPWLFSIPCRTIVVASVGWGFGWLLSKIDHEEPSQSRMALVAAFALPIFDLAAILLVRTITSPENRTAALGLYAFVFPIACAFVLFSLLASGRRPNGHVIAYSSSAGLMTLFNFSLIVFLRGFERAMESL